MTIRLAAVQTRSLPGQVEAKCGRAGQRRMGGPWSRSCGRNALLPWPARDHDGGNREARAGIPVYLSPVRRTSGERQGRRGRYGRFWGIPAVEWAAREAALRSVPLRIVSAASLPKMVALELRPEREAALGFVRDYRDRALADAAARARRRRR